MTAGREQKRCEDNLESLTLQRPRLNLAFPSSATGARMSGVRYQGTVKP